MLARLVGTWSLVAVAGVLGCGSNQNQVAEAPACEAAEGDLPMDATAQTWAGEYRLVMVATAGDSAGRSVTGGMHLMVQSEELQVPPMGSADGGTRMPSSSTGRSITRTPGAKGSSESSTPTSTARIPGRSMSVEPYNSIRVPSSALPIGGT